MDKIESWMALGVLRRKNVINLRPLQDLCVAVIYKHLPDYCRQAPQPFKHLDVKSMTKLVDGLNGMDEKSLRYANTPVQEVFLHNNTSKVWLYMERCYDFDADRMFKVLPKFGKVNLTFLRLDCIPEDYERELYSTLRALVSLETLILSHRGSNCTDVILQIVGSKMPQLKTLNIGAGFDKLTDKGIAYLCKDDGKHGKCKKLKTISFGSYDSNITVDGLLLALENLPELTYWKHRNMFQAVLNYGKKHGKQLPKFGAYISIPYSDPDDFDYDEDDEQDEVVITNENLELFINTVPNFAVLTITGDTDIKASTIAKANKYDTLVLKGSYVTQTYVEEIIMKIGPNILDLRLKTDNQMDVSVIGNYCINLRVLYWNCVGVDKFKFNLENQLNTLEGFEINDVKFPRVTLKSMLKSEKLDMAKVYKLNCLDDNLLEEILMEAYKDPKIFSNLTYIELIDEKLTFKTLSLLIILAPKLEEQLLGSFKMSDQHRNMLNDLVKSFDPLKHEYRWERA